MSITWTTYKLDSREVESTKVTHEGLVVSESWTTCERVMSDIYADVSHVRVWNPETRTVETVTLGYHFELCSTFGRSVVDASPEILAEVARQAAEATARKAAADKAAYEAREAAREEARRNAPEHGKLMVVTRGRKVPVGTTGKVFWMRDGRVGLALDDTKDARGHYSNVAWVDAAYLKAA